MASIIINSACNLRCPFCFATESRSCEPETNSNMDVEEFDKYLAFDNNIVTSLCGGEPTLHSNFIDYMEKMFAVRGKFINLLTNGLWNEKVCDYIKNLEFNKAKRIMYLFNILDPSLYTDKQLEMLDRALSSINSETAYIGFTIYKKDFDYSYIFDFAKKYNITRIRYSIAAPNITDESTWNVDPKSDFKEMASIIYNFVTEAVAKGFEVNPDCGYLPPCAYTKEQLADLLLIQPGIKFSCDSVGDIGKGGQTWRCYGLFSSLNRPIDTFKNVQELQEYYTKESELLLNIDILEECSTCEYKEREICNGGCLAYRMIKKLKNGEDITINQLNNEENYLKLIPKINQKVLKIWDQTEEEKHIYIRKKQKMQVKRLDNTKELKDILNKIDAKKSIQDIIDELSGNYENYDIAKSKIIEITKTLFFNDALKML